MKPEILAKIIQIARKTGEKVVFVDSDSGNAYVLMGLEVYEGVLHRNKTGTRANLTEKTGSGSMDTDLALWQEASASSGGDWGGDDSEDKFYMEPIE